MASRNSLRFIELRLVLVAFSALLTISCQKKSDAPAGTAQPPPTETALPGFPGSANAVPTALPSINPLWLPTPSPGNGSCKAGGGNVNGTWAAASGFASAADLGVSPQRPRCSAETVRAYVENRLPDKFTQWDMALRDPGLSAPPSSSFESMVPLIERCFNQFVAGSTLDLSGTSLSIRPPGESIEACFKAGSGSNQSAYEAGGRYSLDFSCDGQPLAEYAGKSLLDPAFTRDFCKSGSSGKFRYSAYVSLKQPGTGGTPIKLYRRLIAIGDKSGNSCSFAVASGGKRTHPGCVFVDKIEREDGLAWFVRAEYGTARVSYSSGMVLSGGKVDLSVGAQNGSIDFPAALASGAGAPGAYKLGFSIGSPYLSSVSGSMPQR